MSLRHNMITAAALGSLALLPACNPYQNFSGEYFAGPVDGTTFPAAYQGDLPGPADQGAGTITPFDAFVGDAPVFYYMFPVPASQGADPEGAGNDNPLNVDFAAPPPAYVFDPDATNALPSPGKCNFPKNYLFDQRLEAYRGDEQGVIFNSLPNAAYFPVVSEVPVTSHGQACQEIKSAAAVKAKMDGITVGAPDGKYLAFALIDPTADVQPTNPVTGLGPIHEGFYNHFLTLFIDGGYIPTVDVAAQGMVPAHTEFVTQKLYFPSAIPGMDDMGMPVAAPGDQGLGFDVLEAARGDAMYSPICEVWTYDPDVDADGIPVPATSAAAITAANNPTSTGALIYCFQVQ